MQVKGKYIAAIQPCYHDNRSLHLFESLLSFNLGYLSRGKKQFITCLADMETVLPLATKAYTGSLLLGHILSWYF